MSRSVAHDDSQGGEEQNVFENKTQTKLRCDAPGLRQTPRTGTPLLLSGCTLGIYMPRKDDGNATWLSQRTLHTLQPTPVCDHDSCKASKLLSPYMSLSRAIANCLREVLPWDRWVSQPSAHQRMQFSQSKKAPKPWTQIIPRQETGHSRPLRNPLPLTSVTTH